MKTESKKQKLRSNTDCWYTNFWGFIEHNKHSCPVAVDDWLSFVTHDYDDIDRLYIDTDSGGGE